MEKGERGVIILGGNGAEIGKAKKAIELLADSKNLVVGVIGSTCSMEDVKESKLPEKLELLPKSMTPFPETRKERRAKERLNKKKN